MKRMLIIGLAATAILLVVAGKAYGYNGIQSPPARLVSSPYIEVWVDRGDEALYDINDRINIFVRAVSDCYLSVIFIDTEGKYLRLFPRNGSNGFVRGGEVYTIPGGAGNSWRASGPEGIGYIHVIATQSPYVFNPVFTRNGYCSLQPIHGDPFLGINRFTEEFVDSRFVVGTATTSFFIGRRVWYPRYLCNSCHDSRTVSFDPYYSRCRKYIIRTSRMYDYWWRYHYFPSTIGVRFSGPFWSFSLRTSLRRPIPVHSYCRVAVGYTNMYYPRHPRRPYQPPVYPVFHKPRKRVFVTRSNQPTKRVRRRVMMQRNTTTRVPTRVPRFSRSTATTTAGFKSTLQAKRKRYTTTRNTSPRNIVVKSKSKRTGSYTSSASKTNRPLRDQKRRSGVLRNRDYAKPMLVTWRNRKHRSGFYSSTIHRTVKTK